MRILSTLTFSAQTLRTLVLSLLFTMLAAVSWAGGGGDPPADPGPNPNPDIFDPPGNLIKNGNFEFLDGSVGEKNSHVLNDVAWRGWDLYQRIPHWFTSFGSGIEIQRSAAVYPQPEFGGGQYVELDSAENGNAAMNSWMTQAVDGLTPGQEYLLEALYHRNLNTSSEQSRGIAVYWGKHIPGKLICVFNATDSENEWKEMSCNVTATAEQMYLTLAGFGDEASGQWGDGLGGLVDFLRLTVPETP